MQGIDEAGAAVAADVPAVSAAVARLYQRVLHAGSADVAESAALAEELRLPVPVVNDGFATLLRLRLLRRAPDRTGVLLPASPEVAIAELVNPIELEIRERRRRAEAFTSEIMALQNVYFDSRRSRNPCQGIDVIEQVADVRATLAQLARRCAVEVFSAHPGVLSEEAVTEAGPHDAELLNRGVRMRSIYQHPARVHPRMREFLVSAAHAGAEIRTCDEITDRVVLFDREVAVIPNRSGPSGAVLVRDASVVDFLYRGLEQRWSSSVPLASDSASTIGYGGAGDGLKRAILRLLAAGAKDDHIARRLSISVRTCRRHIADLMTELQANSRFQAGVLASRAGLLADDSAPVRRADVDIVA